MMDLIGPDVPLTQEDLAAMLGVRRTSVSEVATRLQDDGVISYKRGHIRIEKRQRLMELACECYRAVKLNYERLFRNLLHR
jgi:Mn-dependent DtxR family transcriptional regulator